MVPQTTALPICHIHNRGHRSRTRYLEVMNLTWYSVPPIRSWSTGIRTQNLYAPNVAVYQIDLHSNKRRAQDSNLQSLSAQRFSRPLPHRPDTRHIILANIIFVSILRLQLTQRFFVILYPQKDLDNAASKIRTWGSFFKDRLISNQLV